MDSLPEDHIRLLHIGAGSGDQPILCWLSNEALAELPSYEALSYTWGEPDKNRVIICDGSPLGVTRNLYAALRHLRKSGQERKVWIDAICIRQEDEEEKTQQVRMMKEIYKRATHVVIWFGEEAPEDKVAFDLLYRFEEAWAKFGEGLDFGPFQFAFYDYNLPATDAEDWWALVKFFQKPWFSRIWILQEVKISMFHKGSC
jgi:hypothetical protein